MSIKVNSQNIIQQVPSENQVKPVSNTTPTEPKQENTSTPLSNKDTAIIKTQETKSAVQTNIEIFDNKNSIKDPIKVSKAIDFNNKNLTSSVIKTVQEHFKLPPTGVFDEATALKTFEFQKQEGLKDDGKIGKNTFQKLNDRGLKLNQVPQDNTKPIDSNIKIDPSRLKTSIDFNNKYLPAPVIKTVQEHFKLPTTGVFDEATALKTFEFQKQEGLKDDGKIGKNTFQKLNDKGLKVENGAYPRYDKMFEDGVLDVSVGVGYDESGWGNAVHQELGKKLEDRGYKPVSKEEASQIFKKYNIKEAKNETVSVYFKENISTHNNKPVAGIVRVIKPNETDGSKAKEAFIDGLNNSDVSVYAGHGRYGTGMDFDRNFNIKSKVGGKEVTFGNYENFEKELDKPEYKEILNKAPNKNMNKNQKIDYLIEQKVIEIETFNKGNIVFNNKSAHSNEFGGHLTEKAINSPTDKPALFVDSIEKTEKYKLWNISACRTDDYLATIKQSSKTNSNLQSKNLDMFTTKRVQYWDDTTNNVLAVIDGVTNNESASQIKKRLENVDIENQKDIITSTGFNDNPSVVIGKK